MGNSVPINYLCCNSNFNSQNEDLDINKNMDVYNKEYRTIKIQNKKINNEEIKIKNKTNEKIKKMQTYSKYCSSNGNNQKYNHEYNRGSMTYKDGNISLFNNTFQILNNTQQYISFPNTNLLKNNLINNQLLKSIYNSKISYSGLNISKINSNIGDILVDINIKLILTGDLFLNKIIEIDKYGMKNSLRKDPNGVTIFGYKRDNINPTGPLCDYYFDLQISQKENNNQNRNKKHNFGKVFEISFNTYNTKSFVFISSKLHFFANTTNLF